MGGLVIAEFLFFGEGSGIHFFLEASSLPWTARTPARSSIDATLRALRSKGPAMASGMMGSAGAVSACFLSCLASSVLLQFFFGVVVALGTPQTGIHVVGGDLGGTSIVVFDGTHAAREVAE